MARASKGMTSESKRGASENFGGKNADRKRSTTIGWRLQVRKLCNGDPELGDITEKRQNLRWTAGGTLILVKNSLKHYCLPTPPLRALEATNIILTPPKHDPISITCVYIPPSSDENLFTIDIEHFIQTASNCILFGDFNATHNAWNCKNNTTRGRHLFKFANMLNLNIAFNSTPTRCGHNSANTIDIALIKNFYYPFTINSIDDLSSDHNPVFLNFNFKLAEAPPNP
ncbi:hypothetical protein TNCV_2200021 [Trichonephila clavipes]|nr:hypothetical protein TNCV_2200021 [Trichonephila clavipes]